ncbi:MAG: patatin-like phospholipase family protein [Deltaproteobacteria bacterium]|nr:patatin-like phospholipase family protein [Deltaproteobacteria bacterium]
MRGKTGLVLSGGGARGAYEVGVLQYIYEEFGRHARFDILSGSSVGAINAGFAAAASNDPAHEIASLVKVWSNLRLWDELHYGIGQLLRLPLLVFGRIPIIGNGMTRIALGHSLFDVRHLVEVVRTGVPWERIQDNLKEGHFESLAITATEILSGTSTTFVETSRMQLPPWTRDSRHKAEKTVITSAHALASSAIPLLFPLVGIDGRAFCDGGMRQNTPIGPTLRLGADRLLVIRLKTSKHHRPLLFPFDTEQPPPSFLIGKLFNALFLDQLDYDLDRLDRINQILEDGEETFGPDFAERLAQTAIRHRGQQWRKVHLKVIAPSDDLGAIAAEVIREPSFRKGMPLVWRFIMRYLDSGRREEADLLSYLLFDGHYCRRLMDLGYRDGKNARDDLARFFEGAEKARVIEPSAGDLTAGGT